MFEINDEVKKRIILAIRAAHGREHHVEFIPLPSGGTLIMSAESPGLTSWKLIGESDLFGAPDTEDVTDQIAEAMASDLTWIKHLQRGGAK